ncbi:unnamed protein product [Cuscuta epithymum]|uniref:Uncharacterized protein n=1 Tax=Cuscuta epithymum TaxID=186058 RepID=A0AAV0G7Z0_9ASTE|nr:unnamed protein product [Cuscuta epithymum]CAH9143868.1 unnamed protein product [Cuscuta epithymum]
MESSSNSLSNSAASSVAQAPTMRPKEEQEVTSANAKEEVKEKKVPEEKTLKRSPIELLEEAQNEKFKRYEAECTQYLMSKYFSDKTIFGGNIFDVKMTIDGEPIKVSRFPGYLSYADPANFQDESSCSSNSTAGTPTCSANGNHHTSLKNENSNI